MLSILFVYLSIGVLLNLFGPLARKINTEIDRLDNKYKLRRTWGNNEIPTWKRIAFVVILRSFGLLCYPLLYGILVHDYWYEIRRNNDQKPVDDAKFLYFHWMGGVGSVYCNECDTKQRVVSFLHGHGLKWSKTGYQCQKCGQFHEIENDGENEIKNCTCGGKLSRDEPVFCPNCKSKEVGYFSKYIT